MLNALIRVFRGPTMLQRVGGAVTHLVYAAASGYVVHKLVQVMIDNDGSRKRIEIQPVGDLLVARVKLGFFKDTVYSVPLNQPQALARLMAVLQQDGYHTELVDELRVRMHAA